MPSVAADAAPTPRSWREIYPVHPCADVYPMMTDAELDALADDIAANGLKGRVVLWRPEDDANAERIAILDGRNRLEALARLGVTFTAHGDAVWPDGHVERIITWNHDADPDAFAISANIRRRHLTKEQQAEYIVKTIEARKKADRATVARSVTRDATTGHLRGSQKDPVLTAAVGEGAKHGISKRTIQHARAKLNGKPQAPRTKKIGRSSTPPTSNAKPHGDASLPTEIVLALKAVDHVRAEVRTRIGKAGSNLQEAVLADLLTVEATLWLLHKKTTRLAQRPSLALGTWTAGERQEALAVVAAGRRTLAAKRHPDVGGDAASMVRLNVVAERLERSLGGRSKNR